MKTEIINGLSANKIEYLPSYSSHRHLALKIINEALEANKEYANALYVLSLLPALIWACNANKERSVTRRPEDKEVNKLTNYLIKDVKDSLSKMRGFEGDAIKALHLGWQDVSTYIMNTYYKAGLECYCDQNYQVVNSYACRIVDIFKCYESEDMIALHDIDMLLGLYKCSNERAGTLFKTQEGLNDALKALETYEFATEDIKGLMELYISGLSENKIAFRFNKSQSYVKTRIDEGKDAIGIYLWGLSTKRSIEWLRRNI